MLAVLASLLVFLVAGPATANPSQRQYENPITTEQAPANVARPAQPTHGGLPFTGLQLGLIVVIAVGVAVLGIGIRRSGRDPEV
jgi:hypothetical protein